MAVVSKLKPRRLTPDSCLTHTSPAQSAPRPGLVPQPWEPDPAAYGDPPRSPITLSLTRGPNPGLRAPHPASPPTTEQWRDNVADNVARYGPAPRPRWENVQIWDLAEHRWITKQRPYTELDCYDERYAVKKVACLAEGVPWVDPDDRCASWEDPAAPAGGAPRWDPTKTSFEIQEAYEGAKALEGEATAREETRAQERAQAREVDRALAREARGPEEAANVPVRSRREERAREQVVTGEWHHDGHSPDKKLWSYPGYHS